MKTTLKKYAVILLTVVFSAMLLVGCSNNKTTTKTNAENNKKVEDNQKKADEKVVQNNKDGNKELFVYCAAALKSGMTDIGKKFEEKNGVKVNFNFASCAQNVSQMELSKKGDVDISGSLKYYKIVKEKKLGGPKTDIAHHIPAIAVNKDNPKHIKSLEDLAKKDVKVVLGNKDSAIGMISGKILEQSKLKEKVMKNVVAKTATVNEIIVHLKMNQGNAAIVWEENVINNKDLKEIPIDKKNNKIQTIPACVLNSSKDKELANKFVQFIVSDEGKAILKKHGFKTMDQQI